MSGTEVGSAFVSILPSLKGFSGTLSPQLDPEAEKAGKQAGQKLGSGLGSSLKDVAKNALNPLTAGLAGLGALHALGGFIDDARESAKIGALTAQVIKSTGGAAQLTADQVGNLATAVSNKTGVDDEAIQSGENLLLTFTNIKNAAGKGNDIFTQTTQIMTDMSVALGQDTKSSAIQLGKALNDPIKGVSALSKVGVSFTQQQKDQIATLIKSGDTMGAQRVILNELGKEFGGAAAAASTPMDKLKVSLGNVAEAIGGQLIPFVDGAAGVMSRMIPVVTGVFGVIGSLTGFVTSNKTAFEIAAGVIGAVFLPAIVAMGVASVVAGAQAVGAWVASAAATVTGAVQFSIQVARVAAGWVLMGVQSLLSAAKMAAAWLIAMGPIAIAIAAVVGITILVVKNWDTIKNVTVAAWDAVVGAVKSAVGFVSGLVSGVIDFIGSHWKLILGILTGPIGLAASQIASHWDTIKSDASAAWDWVRSKIEELFGKAKSFVSTGIDTIVGFFTGMPGRLASATIGLFDGIKDAFRSAINWVIDQWNGLQFSIPGVDTHIPGVGKVGGFTLGTPNIPRLADGGLVTRPTIALIGEAGPEAVVPLSKAQQPINLTIQHFGRDFTPAVVIAGLNQAHIVSSGALFAGTDLAGVS